VGLGLVRPAQQLLDLLFVFLGVFHSGSSWVSSPPWAGSSRSARAW
jgi:hypothetical protein